MSWEAVARKDFQDSVRSRWLWILAALFALIVTLATGVLAAVPDIALVLLLRVQPGTDIVVSSSVIVQAMNGILVTPLVPLIALVVSHGAISHERESGSLKLLMALPHSRQDVVVGKVLGRSATMAAAIVVGFVLPFLVLAVASLATAQVAVQPLEYLGYVALTCALAVVFVSIGVGISASMGSQFRALVTALAFYVVFILLWAGLQLIGGFAVLILVEQWPTWVPFSFTELRTGLKVVNPTGSFKIISRAFLNDVVFAESPGKRMPDRTLQLSAVLMLLFWALAPLTVGIWDFGRSDL